MEGKIGDKKKLKQSGGVFLELKLSRKNVQRRIKLGTQNGGKYRRYIRA